MDNVKLASLPPPPPQQPSPVAGLILIEEVDQAEWSDYLEDGAYDDFFLTHGLSETPQATPSSTGMSSLFDSPCESEPISVEVEDSYEDLMDYHGTEDDSEDPESVIPDHSGTPQLSATSILAEDNKGEWYPFKKEEVRWSGYVAEFRRGGANCSVTVGHLGLDGHVDNGFHSAPDVPVGLRAAAGDPQNAQSDSSGVGSGQINA